MHLIFRRVIALPYALISLLMAFSTLAVAIDIKVEAKLSQPIPVVLDSKHKQSGPIKLAKSDMPSVSLFYCPDSDKLKDHLCLLWLDEDRNVQFAHSHNPVSKPADNPGFFILMKPEHNEHAKMSHSVLGTAATPYKNGAIMAYVSGSIETPEEDDASPYTTQSLAYFGGTVQESNLFIATIEMKHEGDQYTWSIKRSSLVEPDRSGHKYAGTPYIAVIGDRVNVSFTAFDEQGHNPISKIIEFDHIDQIGIVQHISAESVSSDIQSAQAPQLLNIPENTFNYAAYPDSDSAQMVTLLQTKAGVDFNSTLIPAPSFKSSWLYALNQMDMTQAYMVTLLATDTHKKQLHYSMYPDIFEGGEAWSKTRSLPSSLSAIGTSMVVFSGEQPAILLPGLTLKDYTLSLQAFSIIEVPTP